MPRRAYSWKLKREIGLLTDEEWAPIGQLFRFRLNYIAEMRAERPDLSPMEAARLEPRAQRMLDRFEQLTGDRLDHPDQLWSVRMADYGSPCPACGRPFRTPKAKICMECGHQLPKGEIAGPLRLLV